MPETTTTNTAAHSVITLWSETGLLPDHNAVIENIEAYLNSHSSTTISSFQFLELKPKMTVKVQMGQENLQFDSNYDIDYCHIAREGYGFDDTGAYYFVVGKHWKSKDCLELELEMDTLNSFKWDVDYTVSDRTLVKRQLKDRFSRTIIWTYTSDLKALSSGSHTFKITTPLTASARIKSVSAVTLIGGQDGAKGTVTFTNSAATDKPSGYFTVTIDIPTPYPQGIQFYFTYKVYAYMANVDLKSEGINPPLYKVNETNIPDPSGTTWSLLYKNEKAPDPNELNNAVDCFLYPGREITIEVPKKEPKLDLSNTIDNGWMIFSALHNTPTPSFIVNNEPLTPSYRKEDLSSVYIATAIAFKKISGQISVQFCSYGRHFVPETVPPYGHLEDYCTWVDKGSYDSIQINTSAQYLKYNTQPSLPSTADAMKSITPAAQGTSTVALNTGNITEHINSKDDINRTDSQNIKLITLPYCPTPITISNTNVITGPEWYYTDNTLKLTNKNIKFKNTIKTSCPPLIADVVWDTYQAPLDGTGIRSVRDPKLHHSDYYYKKFVYDSFSKTFRTECLDWEKSLKISKNADTPRFTFDFITSRNIISKFLFMFPQYTTGSKGVEDYDNVLPIARNNEEVLYNSQYLNYLRNGYNYDLKTKDRNLFFGVAETGLKVAGVLSSLALKPTFGAYTTAAGVFGTLTGLPSNTIHFAQASAQAEQDIQQKLQETQSQAVSVNEADDYDLLEAYSGNMAKMCTYEVSDQMKKALDDMFYYSGYVVNAQYKPDVNIRYWFDFLQADLVVNHTENLTKEITDLLKQKFSEGVTFFHCHGGKWDLAQEKENWEKWIVLANGGAE